MQAPTPAPPPPRRTRWPGIVAGALLLMLVTIGVTLWVARTWLFPTPFEPVRLNAIETRVLDDKLARLGGAPFTLPGSQPAPGSGRATTAPDDGIARPEAYREDPAARTVRLSQRELNALLANKTDLGQRVALHLGRDTVSANIIVPIPADFPIMAGQNLRLTGGLGLRHEQGRAVVVLEGVSLMGVPLPAAWLGGLKGRDLIAVYGAQEGFWRQFAAGIEQLRVEDGQLTVQLAP